VHPSFAVARLFFGSYAILRVAMTGIIAVWGLDQPDVLENLWLIPVWDALACILWLLSFSRSSIRWRGADYYIRDGQLVPVNGQKADQRKAAA
jgi:hypothetical protein